MAREFKVSNQQEENLAKVYLNSEDDFIYINEKDATIFDKFAEFLKWLDGKNNEVSQQEAEFDKKYGKDFVTRNENGDVEDVNVDAFVHYSKMRSDTYKETVERIDAIFGVGTIRKYFRKFYEINPDFVPDDECIYDFLDEMTPILNTLFSDRAKRVSLKYNRNRKGGKRSKYRDKEDLIKSYMGK